MTFRNYQNKVIEQMIPVLQEIGFEKYKKAITTFYKQTDDNIDFLVFGNYGKLMGNRDYYKFFISGGRKLGLIEDCWEDFRINPLAKDDPLIWANGKQSTFWIEPIDKWGEFATLIELSPKTNKNELIENTCLHLLNQYNDVIAPRLTTYSDIKLLNSVENENGLKDELQTPFISKGNGYWFRKLIIAKLSDNENYKEIYHAILEKFEGFVKNAPTKSNQNQLWVLKKLYERLQTNVNL